MSNNQESTDLEKDLKLYSFNYKRKRKLEMIKKENEIKKKFWSANNKEIINNYD